MSDIVPTLSFQLSSTSLGLRLRAEMRDEEKAKIDRIFTNIYSIPQDIDIALEEIADYMRTSFAENFDSQGRPSWEPLSPDYLLSRQDAGHGETILNVSGELRSEVTEKGASGNVQDIVHAGTTTTLIMGGSSFKYETHQKGASGSRGAITASPGKKLRFFYKGVLMYRQAVGPASFTIPARPMVEVQDEDRAGIVQILRRFINDKLGV